MEESAVVVINATIYPWQKQALLQKQREWCLLSLSETLRSILTSVLPHPSNVELSNEGESPS